MSTPRVPGDEGRACAPSEEPEAFLSAIGTCDWGDCDRPVAFLRFDVHGHGWLPVCDLCARIPDGFEPPRITALVTQADLERERSEEKRLETIWLNCKHDTHGCEHRDALDAQTAVVERIMAQLRGIG